MPRMKSDISKAKDGRAARTGSEYVAWIKANEAKSIGTATVIFDPVSGRGVDTLSVGEKLFYFTLRWDENVKEIYEQVPLKPSVIAGICAENGFNSLNGKTLSTDFFVVYKDDSYKAFSVKYSADALLHENEKQKEKNVIRQYIEKKHWEYYGVPFEIVFRENINENYARNIDTVMQFYDDTFVDQSSPITGILHKIAHRKIEYDLSSGPIDFAELERKFA